MFNIRNLAFFVVFCNFLISPSFCDLGSKYDGYKMYRVSPKTKHQVQALTSLESAHGVLFPMFSPTLGRESDMLVSPLQSGLVFSVVNSLEITYQEKIKDVGEFIRSHKVSTTTHDGKLYWDEYYTLDAINEFLETQVTLHSPNASLINIGTTFEGRNLTVLKLAKNTGTQPKPVVYIESNIHAREWITSAVCTYVIDQLLNGPDLDMLSYLDVFDIYIVPIANPDGFAFTHDVDRFWRKTRSNSFKSLRCKGADPNRNFDSYWMENGGASDDPCSNVYAGDDIFSELECKAMAEFMNQTDIKSRMAMFLSLHSAGQYLLIPTGLNATKIPEYDEYMLIANNTATAHMDVYGTNFTAGSIFDVMYPATGSSMDWAYLNVPTAKFHVTYELRDKGTYGHLLPPNQILPSCIEFIPGFKVLMESIQAKL